MSMLLYEPAFAVITVAFGAAARKAITVIAVAGGLASTIFWPLTQALVAAFGWRHTLLVVALIHFAVCVPLHAAFLPGKVKRSGMPEPGPAAAPSATRDREIGWRGALAMGTFWMLAVAFSANMLAYSALTVHLIAILHEKGFSMSSAVWLAALVGPMQVVGRTVEFAIASRFRVSQVAVFALAILPVALLSLGLAGSDWGLVVMFVAACGFSNGIMTIARGTIPATVFGRENYGAIAGMMSAPVLLCRAFGPILGAMIWSRYGNYDAVLWTLAGFALVALNFFHLGMRRRPVAA
jgi:predicted MFS family arabinose efflux permease